MLSMKEDCRVVVKSVEKSSVEEFSKRSESYENKDVQTQFRDSKLV